MAERSRFDSEPLFCSLLDTARGGCFAPDEVVEAHQRESLCARAGGLGFLPEEIDPSTEAFLGNYPQAFSHVGVVSSGMNPARHPRGRT